MEVTESFLKLTRRVKFISFGVMLVVMENERRRLRV